MPTIDELVATVSLDFKDFDKGQKELVVSVGKAKTEVVKHGAAIETAVTKAANSFETLAAKALTVLAIFAGARSIEQFTAKISTADAAVGRLSASMGRSPDEVSAIGKAVERMGGSADTAMSGLRSLSDAFEDLRTKGSTAIMEPLSRLQALSGKSIEFGKDVHKNFLSIADALKAEAAKDPALAHNLGRQILGSDDLTNLAIQGREAVLAAEAKSRQLGVTSPKDAQAGQNLVTTFRELSELAEDVGRKIVTATEPALTAAMKAVGDWTVKNREWIQTGIVDAIGSFTAWLQKVDWTAVGKQVSDFGGAFVKAASAVDSLAKAFAPGGALSAGIVAFGVLALAQVSGPLATLARTMVALGLLNPAVLGTLGIGAVLASGDPEKSVLDGGHPDVAPQDNDLGLPGVGDRTSDTSRPAGVLGSIGAWVKANAMPDFGKAMDQLRAMGFGDRLRKDDRAADAAVETAEGVKKLVAQGEKAATGTADGSAAGGLQGVTTSSGGLGGSGRHVGGNPGRASASHTSPGAALGDHALSPKSVYSGKGDIGRAKAGTLANGDESMRFWMSKGLSAEAAAGLVGMEQGEALHDPGNKTGDGGAAHGSFQWHPDRRRAIRAATGIDIDHATHAQQLEAAYWEFTQGNDTQARQAWRQITRPGVTAAQSAAIGTTLFERPLNKGSESVLRGRYAEGWLRRHRENGVNGAAPPTAQAPVPAGTSAAAVTDAQVFAARQRIINGGRDPNDRAMIERYKEQQAKPEKPAKSSFLDGLGRQAPAHVATIAAGAQMAAHAAHSTVTHHNDNSSETHIGSINVQTAATDARGIAADIGPALRRGQRAAKANYGLA